MTSKYRIIKREEYGVRTRFKVQRRNMFFLWTDLKEFTGHTSVDLGPIFRTKWCDTLDEARAALTEDKKYRAGKLSKPTVKHTIIEEV